MRFNNLGLFLAIDLGTSNTLAGALGKGIIFEEPTLVARQRKRLGRPGSIIAFGKKAKQMVGKEPRQIEVVEPLIDGAIADFDATVAFLKYLVDLTKELPSRLPRILKPKAIIGVPSGITEVERRAVRSAGLGAGLGQVFLVEEPMATAIGVGLTIEKAAGNLIIDIGGGITEIALISLGGIVLNRCLKVAGQEMDRAIVNFIRLKYGVLIGLPTAERIKIAIGSVVPENGEKGRKISVKGRALETGLPRKIEISEEEVREALSPIIQEISSQLNELLEETPPELTADILKRGIVLTGGGSLLRGMEKMFSQVTKMPVWIAQEPKTSVVRGCLKLVENEDLLKRVKLSGGMR